MKKLRRAFYGVLVGILMALPSCAVLADQLHSKKILRAQQEYAWQIACEMKQFDCEGLRAPDVGWATLQSGLFGYYQHGSPVVVINIDLMGTGAGVAVMVHEMIHALQWLEDPEHKRKLEKSASCAREAEAFELTWKANQKYDLTTHPEVAPRWTERVFQYGCLD